MKKTILKTVKRVVEKTVIRSANTTSSLWAHQPKAPKDIEKYKK